MNVRRAIANKAYAALPRTPGANRFDKTWRPSSDVSIRAFVGQMTRGTASWTAYLLHPKWHVEVALGRKLYNEIYVGTEKPYQGDDRKYWKVYSAWYLKRANKYGWKYWRAGYLHGSWRKLSKGLGWWKIHWYDGFLSVSITHKGDK